MGAGCILRHTFCLWPSSVQEGKQVCRMRIRRIRLGLKMPVTLKSEDVEAAPALALREPRRPNEYCGRLRDRSSQRRINTTRKEVSI